MKCFKLTRQPSDVSCQLIRGSIVIKKGQGMKEIKINAIISKQLTLKNFTCRLNIRKMSHTGQNAVTI